MTGQVKEDILVRFGELGIFVNNGELSFNPSLLWKKEFSTQEQWIEYQNIRGGVRKIKLLKGQLAFTYCQTLIVYILSTTDSITLYYTNSKTEKLKGKALNKDISNMIFGRNGTIEKVEISVNYNSIA